MTANTKEVIADVTETLLFKKKVKKLTVKEIVEEFIRVMEGRFYYYFTLVVNIIGIILGCIMIIWPSVLLFSTGFIIGTYLILLGIDNIVVAFNEPGYR